MSVPAYRVLVHISNITTLKTNIPLPYLTPLSTVSDENLNDSVENMSTGT